MPSEISNKLSGDDLMQQIVQGFSTKRVLVVGDVMLDTYDFCYTEQSRPSPEKKGAKVYRASRQLKVMGGAANVAANCASMGAQTVLLGVCGEDSFAHELKACAEKAGVQVSWVHDGTRRTTVKTRLYIDDDYILRRDDETLDEVNNEVARLIYERFEELMSEADVVILSDYNKGLFTEVGSLEMIQACRKRGVPVVVDFKPPNKTYFRGADILAPNLVEAQAISADFSLQHLERGCAELRTLLGADNLIVTLGDQGMCGQGGDGFFQVPVHRVAVVDPVGCGDTVRAVLALAFASGLSLEDSARLANRAASLAVQRMGTVAISAQELLKQL
jgi:D-beta-D-heptose 7-phosphate kinase/D-beta-D-heptose 1-phosphate adenosyltransferase